jgi:hypothetical protein
LTISTPLLNYGTILHCNYDDMAKLNLIAGLNHAFYRSPYTPKRIENLQSYELSDLYAINFPARRILYRRILHNVLKAFQDTSSYLVTLCHSGHSAIFQEPESPYGPPFLQFPDLPFIRLEHQAALRGFNYFGSMECHPFLFSERGSKLTRIFNWHSHCIVSDTSPKILSAHIRALKHSGKWNPVHSFQIACHWRTITHSIDRVVSYMLKFPRKEHVITRYKYETLRPNDYRRLIRVIPGYKTSMVAYWLLRDLPLEDLLMAGGAGSAVRKAVLRQARLEYLSAQNKLCERMPQRRTALRQNEDAVEISRFGRYEMPVDA